MFVFVGSYYDVVCYFFFYICKIYVCGCGFGFKFSVLCVKIQKKLKFLSWNIWKCFFIYDSLFFSKLF